MQAFLQESRVRREAPELASEAPAPAVVQLNQRSSHVLHLGVRGKRGFVHDWGNIPVLNSS